MWGIGPAHDKQTDSTLQLPPIDLETIMAIAVVLLLARITFHKLMLHMFQIKSLDKKHRPVGLEHSWFYHLSIVILVLSEVNWNGFDLSLWSFSYILVGMIRQSVYAVAVEKNILLNDYSYNNRVVVLLASSKLYGALLFLLSFLYFMVVHTAFLGISVKLTSLLLFPTLMLATDSLFLWLGSTATSKDLLCFYNPNINQIPPTYKLDLLHTIISSSIRGWHYYNIFRIFFRTFLEKIEFLDCMWILSVVNAGYLSVSTLARSLAQYRSYNKLIERMNRIFKKNPAAPDQICIICMEQLLNCRKLSNCGHIFHYKCLFQWIQTKYECPICRVPINLN